MLFSLMTYCTQLGGTLNILETREREAACYLHACGVVVGKLFHRWHGVCTGGGVEAGTVTFKHRVNTHRSCKL